jgi:hypothetical protein
MLCGWTFIKAIRRMRGAVAGRKLTCCRCYRRFAVDDVVVFVVAIVVVVALQIRTTINKLRLKDVFRKSSLVTIYD